MKCTSCKNGYMEVVSSNYLQKVGIKARRYKCRSCGYKLETVEVSRKEHTRQHRLVTKVNVAISEYVRERNNEGM